VLSAPDGIEMRNLGPPPPRSSQDIEQRNLGPAGRSLEAMQSGGMFGGIRDGALFCHRDHSDWIDSGYDTARGTNDIFPEGLVPAQFAGCVNLSAGRERAFWSGKGLGRSGIARKIRGKRVE